MDALDTPSGVIALTGDAAAEDASSISMLAKRTAHVQTHVNPFSRLPPTFLSHFPLCPLPVVHPLDQAGKRRELAFVWPLHSCPTPVGAGPSLQRDRNRVGEERMGGCPGPGADSVPGSTCFATEARQNVAPARIDYFERVATSGDQHQPFSFCISCVLYY